MTRRCCRLSRIGSGARYGNALPLQRGQGFDQAGDAPVQDMVVGEHAAIDAATVRHAALAGLMR